jgi:hypothetical protein
MTSGAASPNPAPSSSGHGLIGLLIATLVLGVLAVVVIGGEGAVGSGNHRRTSQTFISAAAPGNAAANLQASAAAACRTDYQAVTSAVSYYEVLNGRPPDNMTALRSVLRDPVSSSRFSITIDPARPGQVDVAAGDHPAAPGDGNCTFAG